MDFSWKLDPRVWLVVTPFQLSLCNTDVVIPIVFISGAFDKLPMGEGGVYVHFSSGYYLFCFQLAALYLCLIIMCETAATVTGEILSISVSVTGRGRPAANFLLPSHTTCPFPIICPALTLTDGGGSSRPLLSLAEMLARLPFSSCLLSSIIYHSDTQLRKNFLSFCRSLKSKISGLRPERGIAQLKQAAACASL